MRLRNGTAKVMDFGIGRAFKDQAVEKAKTGEIYGTPQYMAPEQFSGAGWDQQSDIFSYGDRLL